MKQHHMTGTKTWEAWYSMLKRCNNPKHEWYARYGGRGIKVCERWSIFTNFLADMGEAPPGLWLERRENDKGYEPGNCLWATPKEQTRNRSTTRMLTHEGKTQCLQAWAEELGLNKRTLRERLQRGWPLERALSEPLQAMYSNTKVKP